MAKAWGVKGWKADFVSLAVAGALVAGASPAAAAPAVTATPLASRPQGLSEVLTDLYLGDAPASAADALVRVALERSLHDPHAVGAADLAGAVLDEDAQSSDGSITGAFAYAVPDLDRDRRDDFLKIEYDLHRATYLYDGKVSFEAFRGVDGRRLWTAAVTVTDGFPQAFSMPLGKKLGNGLVVEEIGIVETGSSLATRVALTAFSGRGETVWERSFDPDVVVPGARVEGIALPAYAADVSKGPAVDLLVGRVTLTGPSAGLVHALVAESSATIVDGATGNVFEDPDPETNTSTSPRVEADYQGDWIPVPLPAADASGDGVGDYFYALARPRHEGRLSMRSSADGSELWVAEGIPIGAFTDANVEGDLDGDGVEDLLLTTMLFPPASDQSLPHGDLLRAISGAGGTTMWSGTGRDASVPGDVDRDGVDDVVTSSTFYDEDEKLAGIRYAGFDGSTGRELYAMRHALPYEPSVSALLFTVHGSAGDLDADRVGDYFFNQTLTQAERGSKSASKMVSGRNGRKVFDGHPWVPLFASLDGRGADVFQVDAPDGGRRLVFTVEDGAGGGVVWSAAYRASGRYAGTRDLGEFAPLWSRAGLFSADSCPDVSVIMAGERGVFLVVLDGRDGSLEWSRRLFGEGSNKFASAVDVEQRSRC